MAGADAAKVGAEAEGGDEEACRGGGGGGIAANPLDRRAREPGRAGPAVLKALRANETVCLLCDRDLDRSGVDVEFFGEHTTLPAGPATLSIRTGAPLLPVGCYFTPKYNGHHAVVRPAVPTLRRGGLREDVGRVTQALARELEFLIRRAPEQWHLFQPNWPSDPGYGE